MDEVKLYLDEDISQVMAQVLRSRGCDVVSAHEVGMEGMSDGEQLAWASAHARTLVSFNVRHYAALADTYYREGKTHFGIVVSAQVEFSDFLRLVLNVFTRAKPEYLKNTFRWLQSYG